MYTKERPKKKRKKDIIRVRIEGEVMKYLTEKRCGS